MMSSESLKIYLFQYKNKKKNVSEQSVKFTKHLKHSFIFVDFIYYLSMLIYKYIKLSIF